MPAGDIGVCVPEILLPRQGIDLTRWAVIACDQFTAEPEYWSDVEAVVGAAPSTLNLILPEIHLGRRDEPERIRRIQETMQGYADDGTLRPHTGMVHVQRRFGPRTRSGILLALDLEQYDFQRGASSLVRATEGTIVERLPPRVKVRERASLEVPHVLVLIDDPGRTVIEPISAALDTLEKLYDFELMLGSGRVAGHAIPAHLEPQVVAALSALADPSVFAARYALPDQRPAMLFAVGDGNHSLAAAKAHWNNIRHRVAADHPARYSLVEVVNVHDAGLEFEPIHRILFGLETGLLEALQAAFGAQASYEPVADAAEMARVVDHAEGSGHVIGVVGLGHPYGCVRIANPTCHLAVGTLQALLDRLLAEGRAERIDYVHGTDALIRLGSRPDCAGFYLPRMLKSELFETVILDGALPRKTFSLGEAREKRFYLESRRIIPR
jgi:hypothetical protein